MNLFGAAGIDDSAKVVNTDIYTGKWSRAIRQTCPTLVVSDQLSTFCQPVDQWPPDRAAPIEIQMRKPMADPDQHRSVAMCAPGNGCSVGRGTVADTRTGIVIQALFLRLPVFVLETVRNYVGSGFRSKAFHASTSEDLKDNEEGKVKSVHDVQVY